MAQNSERRSTIGGPLLCCRRLFEGVPQPCEAQASGSASSREPVSGSPRVVRPHCPIGSPERHQWGKTSAVREKLSWSMTEVPEPEGPSRRHKPC